MLAADWLVCSYVSPLIADFIAALMYGPLSNYVCKTMSRKNKGVFEPEFTLLNVAWYGVFATMGLIGFGSEFIMLGLSLASQYTVLTRPHLRPLTQSRPVRHAQLTGWRSPALLQRTDQHVVDLYHREADVRVGSHYLLRYPQLWHHHRLRGCHLVRRRVPPSLG